jgi:hypothetical protein
VNYVQLRAAIQNYAEDFEASFVENVDNFIRLAESRILLKVRLPSFRKDVTAVTTAPPPPMSLLAVPSDFLAPDSLSIVASDGLHLLINKDPEFLDECYPDPASTGQPRFYAYLNNTTLKLGPAPDQAYPVNLGYFFQAPSIVDVGSTWLGNNFAHALVSGSLVEAAIYQKAEDNLYQRHMLMFNNDLAMDEAFTKGRTKKDTQREPDTRMDI